MNLDQMMIDEWKQLGFYYDFDNGLDVNQWRIYGSINGIQSLISLIERYTSNSVNYTLSEHIHLGPYGYLKIMTWDKPILTEDYFAGTIEDLKQLKDIISNKLKNSKPGNTFNIDKEYGLGNSVTVKFFVMGDKFEPYSMDELIVSGRQKIVNEQEKKNKW